MYDIFSWFGRIWSTNCFLRSTSVACNLYTSFSMIWRSRELTLHLIPFCNPLLTTSPHRKLSRTMPWKWRFRNEFSFQLWWCFGVPSYFFAVFKQRICRFISRRILRPNHGHLNFGNQSWTWFFQWLKANKWFLPLFTTMFFNHLFLPRALDEPGHCGHNLLSWTFSSDAYLSWDTQHPNFTTNRSSLGFVS